MLTVWPSDGTARAAWGPGGGGPANPQALNRSSYALNHPLRQTDPTEHWVEVGRCTVEGAAVGSLVPGAGTAAGAVVGFVIGAGIMIGAGALIAYGAAHLPGYTVDAAGAPIPDASAEEVPNSTASADSHASSPSNETGRSRNKLAPDPNAQGPHTTFKRELITGEVISYETYEPNPRNPSGYDTVKRYDGTDAPHYNKKTGTYVPTPTCSRQEYTWRNSTSDAR